MTAINEFHLQSVTPMLHNIHIVLYPSYIVRFAFSYILAAMITPSIVLVRIVVKQVVLFLLFVYFITIFKAKLTTKNHSRFLVNRELQKAKKPF